jgi:hypothetical protein
MMDANQHIVIGSRGGCVEQKNLILESLHSLLSHNVIGDKQYRNRYNGFTAELDFMRWYRNNRTNKLVSGGMFIPTLATSEPFDSAVYLTVSKDSPKLYEKIFQAASSLASNGLFFIRYDDAEPIDQWSMQPVFPSKKIASSFVEQQYLPVPRFTVHQFNPKTEAFGETRLEELQNAFFLAKNQLSEKHVPEELKHHFIKKFTNFELQDLTELYVNRLFFDGFISLMRERGAPLDIDTFAPSSNGTGNTLLEIKEKDVSKRAPQGFGMDLRRIESLTRLEQAFNTPATYVVRRVNNQDERVFIEWLYIRMSDFRRKIEGTSVIEGGHGMRSVLSDNPTKVCDLKHFRLVR